MTVQGTPPGWNRDPGGGAFLRWWDGRQWTGHTQPLGQQGAPSGGHGANGPYGANGAHGPLGLHGPAGPQRQPGPPGKGGSKGWLLAVAVIVVLVVAVGIVRLWPSGEPEAGGESATSPGGQSTAPGPSPSPSTVYLMSERPGYPEMESYVLELYEQYDQAQADGSLYDQVDDSAEGRDYADSFLVLLTDLRASLRWAGGASTNPNELDAQIQANQQRAEELEQRFLAGEDLGASVRVVSADGSVLETDGTAPEPAEPSAEEFAQDYRPEADGEGSYAPAADELAEAFGLELTYEFADIATACSPVEGSTENLVAAYCHATPTLIYVNPDYRDYPSSLNDPMYVDWIRHEIAHHQIGNICSAIFPPIAGELGEAVTSSYAVQYLGADESVLGSSTAPEYAMSADTDEIAQQIHDEQRCE